MKYDLIEKSKQEELIKTGAKPKLPIKITNLTDEMLDVYRIPLDMLYYNDENGRIASSMLRINKKITPAYDEENPEYNNLIESMIAEDNLGALKKTKASIKKDGQKIFGYVLQDGRVIDGNRRFTALRQLSKETGATYFFEAVVLPYTYDSKASRVEVKRLELAIQMGIEERESYDPVDLSVDVYQTVVKDKIMTKEDYSRESNIKINDLDKRIAAVEIMQSFLNFINAKEYDYHIIKDAKLYNPLEELAKKLNKLYPNRGVDYEISKEASFVVLIMFLATGGDTVRDVREYFKNILTTTANNEFIEKIEETIEDIRDNFEAEELKSVSDLRMVIENSTPLIRTINEAYIQVSNKQNRGKNVTNFIGQIKDAKDMLEELKNGNGLTGNLNYSNFSNDQIREIRELMIRINISTKELIEIYEDEL